MAEKIIVLSTQDHNEAVAATKLITDRGLNPELLVLYGVVVPHDEQNRAKNAIFERNLRLKKEIKRG